MHNYCLIFLIFFVFFIGCKNSDTKESYINKNDSALITTKTVFLDSGWGYAIYKDDKLFIYQDLIPAVNGHFLFSTKEKAQKTADFVAFKMSQKAGLPSVTVEELDSLGVLDSNVIEVQKIEFSTKGNKIKSEK